MPTVTEITATPMGLHGPGMPSSHPTTAQKSQLVPIWSIQNRCPLTRS